jgi:hypothetical protein
VKHNHLPQ